MAVRGGTSAYSAKTLNGNWVEQRYDPSFQGVRPQGATSTAIQGLESTRTTIPAYGLGVKPRSTSPMTGTVVQPDGRLSPDKWQTVTRSAYTGAAGVTEFSSSFKPARTVTLEEAEEYRKRWIAETKADSAARFTSTNTNFINNSVAPAQQRQVVRRYPGTSKPIEQFRSEIVDKHGSLGFSNILKLFRIIDKDGTGSLTEPEIGLGLREYGLHFADTELHALWTNFDPAHTGKVSYEGLVRGLTGGLPASRRPAAEAAFRVFDRTSSDRVPLATLVAAYNAAVHPEVKAGRREAGDIVRVFATRFITSETDGKISFADFADYLGEISICVEDDAAFNEFVSMAWKVSA